MNTHYAIPTHIITGFLGTGKTTAISHLLKSKPEGERWAILVNEFGEIGVDGALFSAQHSESSGIFVKEVPGGCMCCTAGFTMQIALNFLLSNAKPHRLFIEPTGLGHPVEVLGILSSTYYQEVLSIQKIITLVDARKLHDERYTSHATFNQQIQIADLIVGNKQDLYTAEDRSKLVAYVKKEAASYHALYFTQQGILSWDKLEGATEASTLPIEANEKKKITFNDTQIPETGYLSAENQGEGFTSIGFRFAPNQVFDRQKLLCFLTGIKAERMKAVFITNEGIFGYNLTVDTLTEQAFDECEESRIEIIAASCDEHWQQQLFNCKA